MSLPAFRPVSAASDARSRDDVSDETLHRILDAAGALFARFGIGRVKVADVAGEAGVSKATVYRYVSSKQSLVQLYGIREGRNFVDRVLRERWRSDLSPEDVPDLVAYMYVEARKHPVVAKLLFDEPAYLQREMGGSPDDFGQHAGALVDLLEPVAVRIGVADPRLTLEALLRMFISLLFWPPLTDGGGEPREDSVRPFFEMAVDPRSQP